MSPPLAGWAREQPVLHRWARWVLLSATAGVGATLLVSSLVATQGGGTASAADADFTIDILPTGFNPPVCQVNRDGRRVTFRNQDTAQRRIISIAVQPGGGPLWDTGDLDPGETWGAGISITAAAEVHYVDADNPELTGVIIAPISPDAPDICTPLPPTPTPTNTPTASPTPSATPTPQGPPRCIGLPGCAVAPQTARDDGEPTLEPTATLSPEPTETPVPTSTPDSDTGPD